MAKTLKPTDGIKAYLSQDRERNEDLVLSYFRNLYPDSFERQSDAAMADGYVAGHFILEIKGDRNDWLPGLFQGLCYEKKGLSFKLVVVVAEGFLGIWDKSNIPLEIRDFILEESGAPSSVGRKTAQKFKSKGRTLLEKATWLLPVSNDLFNSSDATFNLTLASFEKSLKSSKKKRIEITTKNFNKILPEMKEFFDPNLPIKAVRAFYGLIYAPWDENSTVNLSERLPDRATVGGIEITHLVPSKRDKFKSFIENHEIKLSPDENRDDFFAKYDEALDAVDRSFRVKNGIFFTDLDLSKFVMWMAKQKIPNLGKNYIVVDPACGSGNLVTNWRSPLELRHKVVSEIEPELLYAVEQRMKGDQWHDGKFTVVPKVSENKGLNFLDISANEYLNILKEHLKDKGIKPNKPIAFLCNPPYRNDDDQTAESISYQIDPNIIESIGNDASSERYACFIAQMKLICEQAEDSGFPDESVLMLFTKASWLTHRPVYKTLRREILGNFEDIGSVIVDGSEFFEIGKFPIAFTMWKYKGKYAGLNADRPLKIIDLSWLKKKDLKEIDWNSEEYVDKRCREIFKDIKSIKFSYGAEQLGIQSWSGEKRVDFQREKRKDEKNDPNFLCGLPKRDSRHSRKKTLGECDGSFIGFMDDVTPCRIKKNPEGVPWFRLSSPFMDVRKNRCFSGPSDQKSFAARNTESAKKLFSWYFIAKLFATHSYPMWADALELWAFDDQTIKGKKFVEMAFAYALADNECVDVTFPANNPVRGAIEISSGNPMSPLVRTSFWSQVMKPVCESSKDERVKALYASANNVFLAWQKFLKNKNEVVVNFEKPYSIGEQRLKISAGIQQIKDYALLNNVTDLLVPLEKLNELLKGYKEYCYEYLTSQTGLNYFDPDIATDNVLPFTAKTKSEKVLESRLEVAALILDEMKNDATLGLVKFAKILYFYDVLNEEKLEMKYYRQANGPLDPDAIYNTNHGLLSLAKRHGYFELDRQSKQHEFIKGKLFKQLHEGASKKDSSRVKIVKAICSQFLEISSQDTEIIATIYACWNDLLIDRKIVDEKSICEEFFKNWHDNKLKIAKSRVLGRFKWMFEIGFIPHGDGSKTKIPKDKAAS